MAEAVTGKAESGVALPRSLVLDRDLSLFALYLIPSLYSAWFLGVRWGYVSCLASAVVWAIDDWGEQLSIAIR